MAQTVSQPAVYADGLIPININHVTLDLHAAAHVVLQVKCPLSLQDFNQKKKQWVNISRTTQYQNF